MGSGGGWAAFWISLISLVSLLTTSCGGPPAPTTASPTVVTTSGGPPPAVEGGPAGQDLLDAAGAEGAATLFFHPRHWSVLLTAATEIAGDLMPGELRELLGAPGPWEALRIAARDEGHELPATLAGWDDTRPLIVSLFEAPDLPAAELLRLTGNLQPPKHFAHRVVMPATDADTLLASLRVVADTVGCLPAPHTYTSNLEGAGQPYICGELAVIFETGEGYVRVRAAKHEDSETAPAALARPLGGPVPTTPALRWAMDGPVVLAAHARPSRVRRALLTMSATDGSRALHYADSDSRPGMIERAKGELLSALLRTTAVGAEVDDLAAGLMPGMRPTFGLVQGLTHHGAAAYDAGLATPAAAEGPADAPFVIQTSLNIDVMQAVAGVPFGMAGITDVDVATDRIEDCGETCYLHLLSARIFGLGALADAVGLRADLEAEVGPLLRFVPTALPEGQTMAMTLDIPGLMRRMDEDVLMQSIADAIGVVHVAQAREGRTLMTTVRLGEAPPAPTPGSFTLGDPGPVDEPLGRTASATCVENAALLLEGTNEALRSSGLTNRDEVIRQSRQLLDGYGGCSGATGELADIYRGYSDAFEAAAAPESRR